jgi:hypothetical protein
MQAGRKQNPQLVVRIQHTHLCACARTHIYTQANTFAHTRAHTHVHTHACTRTRTGAYTGAHTHTDTRLQTKGSQRFGSMMLQANVQTVPCPNTCISHTHTHTHTHTQTHTHALQGGNQRRSRCQDPLCRGRSCCSQL